MKKSTKYFEQLVSASCWFQSSLSTLITTSEQDVRNSFHVYLRDFIRALLDLVHSQLEEYLTGSSVPVWRKDIVYVSMVLFILSAVLSIGINIFVLAKLKKLKEILNMSGFLVFVLFAFIASCITYLTYIMAKITNELQLPMSLFFNFLSNTFLFYFIFGNEDCKEFAKNRAAKVRQNVRVFVPDFQFLKCFKNEPSSPEIPAEEILETPVEEEVHSVTKSIKVFVIPQSSSQDD